MNRRKNRSSGHTDIPMGHHIEPRCPATLSPPIPDDDQRSQPQSHSHSVVESNLSGRDPEMSPFLKMIVLGEDPAIQDLRPGSVTSAAVRPSTPWPNYRPPVDFFCRPWRRPSGGTCLWCRPRPAWPAWRTVAASCGCTGHHVGGEPMAPWWCSMEALTGRVVWRMDTGDTCE